MIASPGEESDVRPASTAMEVGGDPRVLPRCLARADVAAAIGDDFLIMTVLAAAGAIIALVLPEKPLSTATRSISEATAVSEK